MPGCNASVLVSLMGGLGNQMFQYAAGRAVALRLGLGLELDLSWFSEKFDYPHLSYTLDVFPHAGRCASSASMDEWKRRRNGKCRRRLRRVFGNRGFWRNPYIREPSFAYWEGIEAISRPVWLAGYWQSERYFAAYAEAIRKDFTFPALPIRPATELARQISDAPNSVSVHIRRGDYVADAAANAVHGICSPEYYRTSLAFISQGSPLRLFLFSDDPDWVRGNFDTRGHQSVVVDLKADAVHDMHLMSLCRHHVLANSSFSWWGAWLGVEEGITCAPARWFATSEWDTQDLIPEYWRRVG